MIPTSSTYQGRPPERPSFVFHLAAVAAAAVSCSLLVLLDVVSVGQSQGWMTPSLGGAAGRYAGSVAAGLTFTMAVYLNRFRQTYPNLVRAGWAAASLSATLLLGNALARALHLPEELRTLQNAGALALFMTVFYLAVGTRPFAARASAVDVSPTVRRWVLVASVAMVYQMLMGALVRYADATGGWTSPDATQSIHVLHSLGSWATVTCIAGSALAMIVAAPERPWLRGLAAAVMLLVIAQALLGLPSVVQVLPVASLQAHIGLGVALLAAQWGLYLSSAPARAATPPVSLRGLGRELLALTKPRISGMVVATFGGGLWLAPQRSETWRGLTALLGTLLIVGAANALNMYLERDIDGLMKRTRNRPLPQGRLSAEAAVATGTALLCCSLPLLLIGGNGLTCLLGFVAFASYVFLYTPLKQKSSIALFVGAVPGALPPLMGWTTATNSLDAPGLVLFGILFLWQIPHFLAISVFRVNEYSQAGFKVMPAEHGMPTTRAWALGCAIAMVAMSLALNPLGITGWLYGTFAALSGVAFVALTAAGYRAKNRQDPGAARWGRSVFAASILYLMLLFVVLSVDRLLA